MREERPLKGGSSEGMFVAVALTLLVLLVLLTGGRKWLMDGPAYRLSSLKSITIFYFSVFPLR